MSSPVSSTTTTWHYPAVWGLNGTATSWDNHAWSSLPGATTVTYTLTGIPTSALRPEGHERVFAPQPNRPATPAERSARDEAIARATVVRDAARTRARDILLTVLDEAQRAQYLADGAFELVGSAGNRYRIRRGSAGNVDYLGPGGEVLGRLCAHPTMGEHWLPDPDVALAQLLALTADEPGFVALANVHRGIRPAIGELAPA